MLLSLGPLCQGPNPNGGEVRVDSMPLDHGEGSPRDRSIQACIIKTLEVFLQVLLKAFVVQVSAENVSAQVLSSKHKQLKVRSLFFFRTYAKGSNGSVKLVQVSCLCNTQETTNQQRAFSLYGPVNTPCTWT